MFNLKHSSSIDPILVNELEVFDILPLQQGYHIVVGDDTCHVANAQEGLDKIEDGINELREIVWNLWDDLDSLCLVILQNRSYNSSQLDNTMFLRHLKKIYILSQSFSGLSEITNNIRQLFSVDIVHIHGNLIKKFNHVAMKIMLTHYIIMREIYRTKLLRQYMKISKSAQISGPWSNIDLPMAERMWSFDEDEEYFDQRTKARQEQIRYNPEYTQGFYYIWPEVGSREPYDFNDMGSDSPYKSRSQIRIAKIVRYESLIH